MKTKTQSKPPNILPPIRSCPFCGRSEDDNPGPTLSKTYLCRVICENCGAIGPYMDTEKFAILGWNRRV